MRWNREHIDTGMTVRSSDGQKLGKVIALGTDSFEIEKGFFILKDYLVRYSDILDVRDGEAYLRYGKEDLRPIEADAAEQPTTVVGPDTAPKEPMVVQNANLRAEALSAPGSLPGELPPDIEAAERVRDSRPASEQIEILGVEEETTPVEVAGAAPTGFEEAEAATVELEGAEAATPELERRAIEGTAETTTIPLARERLMVTKHDTQSGEIHIHKSVEVETETVEVPLRHERASVEHVQMGEDTNIEVGDAAFEERDYAIPLNAEAVDVAKETVIDEELRVTKVPYEKKKRVTERLRHEHAEIRADNAEDLEERGKVGWRPEDEEPTRY